MLINLTWVIIHCINILRLYFLRCAIDVCQFTKRTGCALITSVKIWLKEILWHIHIERNQVQRSSFKAIIPLLQKTHMYPIDE